MTSWAEWFGDLVIAILDELKFWIEVFQAYLEVDEEGQRLRYQRRMKQYEIAMKQHRN